MADHEVKAELFDLFSVSAAISVVAGITALSGLIVAVRMYETHSRPAPAQALLAGIPPKGNEDQR